MVSSAKRAAPVFNGGFALFLRLVTAYRQRPAEIEKAQLQFETCHEFRESR